MQKKKMTQMTELPTNDFKTVISNMFKTIKEKMDIMNNRQGISAEKWKLLKRKRTNENF